jgi:hypothetical protein
MQLHVNSLAVGAGGPTALIPAPGAGFRITVLSVAMSAGGTATNNLLSFSATNQKQFRFPAAITPFVTHQIRWEGDPNAALSLTTSGNGPTDISVDYIVEIVS